MNRPSRGRLNPALLLPGLSRNPAAPASPAGITRQEYRSRHEGLARILPGEIPPGGPGVVRRDSAPERVNLCFRQERNLHCLTGSEILALEAGVYIPGKNFGIRFEDDALVTAREPLVRSDRALRDADAVEMQRAEGLKSGSR